MDLGISALAEDSPTTWPIFNPPPASARVHKGPQWSRPASPLMRGVRPNSPVMTSRIFSLKPRSAKSWRKTLMARSSGGHACYGRAARDQVEGLEDHADRFQSMLSQLIAS